MIDVIPRLRKLVLCSLPELSSTSKKLNNHFLCFSKWNCYLLLVISKTVIFFLNDFLISFIYIICLSKIGVVMYAMLFFGFSESLFLSFMSWIWLNWMWNQVMELLWQFLLSGLSISFDIMSLVPSFSKTASQSL